MIRLSLSLSLNLRKKCRWMPRQTWHFLIPSWWVMTLRVLLSNSNERWKDENNLLMFNVENQKPGARSHPSAGPQVSSRLPGPQLSVSWLRNSPVRPTGGLQVLLLPGPEVGGAAGHLRQGVLPPGQPHHLHGPARLRPTLSGGLVLEHWLGHYDHQHCK